jgi:DNA-damage-inducible protein D
MDLMESLRPTFDGLKRLSPNGGEYWMARDLQGPLGYVRWENFEDVINKACMACESSGVDPDNHILQTAKMVPIGSGAQRGRGDYYLSRYGAYLVAMNGDPKLPQIAAAQTYFAIQTRRQELADQSRGDVGKRIELRERVRDANKHLGKAAKASGVQNYALFHAAGYRGLYGMSLKEIKERKQIGKDDLLDRAGRAELAMNEFRITQAEQALIRKNVRGDSKARETHKEVAEVVRKTVADLGGTMPEDLPAEPSVRKLATPSKRKKQIPKSTQQTEPN